MGRRRRQTAERRLGGLQRGHRRFAQDRDQRQVGRAAQFAEVDVAELAGKRVAAPVQLAEPGA